MENGNITPGIGTFLGGAADPVELGSCSLVDTFVESEHPGQNIQFKTRTKGISFC